MEILNWLEDHSRYLIACTVHARVTGDIVVNEFLTACNTYGIPASTLTDNGRVYTARFGGGKNAFEYLLTALKITQKNGIAGHPHLAELQHQLDRYREIYNHHRPHRALDRTTPATAYTALPKATPPGTTNSTHYRLRYDHVDNGGKVSLRRAGRMHHLGVGYDTTITVLNLATSEILSTHNIEPQKTYWRNQQQNPGRWPGQVVT